MQINNGKVTAITLLSVIIGVVNELKTDINSSSNCYGRGYRAATHSWHFFGGNILSDKRHF
jgi:hypothetical protein